MKILEKDLKQIVWESNLDELRYRGFPVASTGKMFKDLKIGNYGSADMILVDRVDGNFNISICVFKEGKIGLAALLEAIKLQKGIDSFLRERKGFRSDLLHFYINLIGSEIDTSGSFCFIPDLYIEISYYLYYLDLNGLSFTSSDGHRLIDEGF